ncbi:hypothetical protein LV779_39130 [Streptomyces thinghirensis]|nr:hypothetical protein [Streptomyces thinghirensis]
MSTLVEASGFPLITPALVRFRLKGGRIIAKVSRTDVAAEFLAPPPERLVARLLEAGEVTAEEARAAAGRPMADDLCVEADGGWLSGTADLLTPCCPPCCGCATRRRRRPPRIGCAGGIGTPGGRRGRVPARRRLRPDRLGQPVLRGGRHSAREVKDILQEAREYDVDTAPWAELFDLGVQARYLKRGLFFPARASRLYELWRRHGLARRAGRRDQEPGPRPVPGRRGSAPAAAGQHTRAAAGGCVLRLPHTRVPPRRER